MKRRKRLPPGDLPETADMMRVEPLQVRSAQSPGTVPQPADERKAGADWWINNMVVHAPKRNWPRKEPRPASTLRTIETPPPCQADDAIPFTFTLELCGTEPAGIANLADRFRLEYGDRFRERRPWEPRRNTILPPPPDNFADESPYTDMPIAPEEDDEPMPF